MIYGKIGIDGQRQQSRRARRIVTHIAYKLVEIVPFLPYQIFAIIAAQEQSSPWENLAPPHAA